MYCRKDHYIISDSLAANETGFPLKQIIPYKPRCGSMNPYAKLINDKCYCEEDSTTNATSSAESRKGKGRNI